MARALLVLKDGHVGSEWFAEAIARQPGVSFIFEMGACITGNLAGKRLFLQEKRGCGCSKEDCSSYRRHIHHAPCVHQPNSSTCAVLGSSHISITSPTEVAQWEQVLRNSSAVLVLVQTRSNLVKWAWSFYRTGALRAVRTKLSLDGLRQATSEPKEHIHLRNRSNFVPQQFVVDPALLLRTVIAKQKRSELLIHTARKFARLVGQPEEHVLMYESMQLDLEGELERIFKRMNLPFDRVAHRQEEEGSLLKTTSEDLSRVMANWDEVHAAFSRFPCLLKMLTDKERRVFAGCDVIGGPECSCTWRTPIDVASESTNFPTYEELTAATVSGTKYNIGLDWVGVLIILVSLAAILKFINIMSCRSMQVEVR
ncbi:hypothetical protein AB1Y20_003811 [Prymnesium parvum]|uniref:Sulfotransferase n=1 Tax=Prymnesium parvum TaxID=97485 RepID=A0AB34J5Z8_PRYPA